MGCRRLISPTSREPVAADEGAFVSDASVSNANVPVSEAPASKVPASNVQASEESVISGKEMSVSAGKEEMRSQVATGDFTWTAQDFPGLYDDIDEDIGAETVTTTITEGINLRGDYPYGIKYTTTAQEKALELRNGT